MKRDERCLNYLVNALKPSTSMSTVDAPTLQEAIERIELAHGNEMPRRALRIANGLWRFAMGKRIVTTNPASGLAGRDFLKPYAKRKFAGITDAKKFGELLRAINGHTGQPVTRIALLQLLARTFVRPGELPAMWPEFDLDSDVPQWVVPQGRMKMRRDPDSSDHVVPLARQSVVLLRELQQHRVDDLAFPSLRKGRPLADATFTAALRTLGYDGNTHVAHGFRASASSLYTRLATSRAGRDAARAQAPRRAWRLLPRPPARGAPTDDAALGRLSRRATTTEQLVPKPDHGCVERRDGSPIRHKAEGDPTVKLQPGILSRRPS